MVHIYFLSEIYLIFSAAVLLADRYGMHLIFLLNARSFYLTGRKKRIVFPLIGLLLMVGLLFFPIEPGPIIIGDLMPAMMILVLVFNFFLSLSGGESENFSGKKDYILGILALAVALLHFLFPSIVII